MSFLRWTSKSTRAIAEEVARLGYPMTPTTVARSLHDLGYSLQATVKTIEGRQYPDRDA
jgi:Rhodopirellula transposase DDE domain